MKQQQLPGHARAGVRLTVAILAACAIGSYVLFMFSVLGHK